MKRSVATKAAAGVAVLLAVIAAVAYRWHVDREAERISYNWHVRPILSQTCFACHGNHEQKAGLRLDLPENAYAEIPEDPGKHAIVPGDPEASELIRRISSTDAEVRMPPKQTHKVLSAEEIATLRQWIKEGARYEQHWAYLPPKEIAPKATRWEAQAVNPIDRYVYARLQKAGLTPAAEADRETLINRVTLDLTGLPPTLQEVDAFVADQRADAYERLVERLLNSLAYAERQANTWLDVARYADSDGFLFDQAGRFQHPYRDWVISAFQRNLPYDKFATWQLAGDKLPNASREQLLATAFGRMGKRSNEAGIIDEEYRVEYGLERTELVGKAFLGLTVGCAKCHDHKYDVISQRDFYSLFAFFNNIDERGYAQGPGFGTPMGAALDWPTPKQSRDLSAARQVTAAKQQAYAAALQSARQAVRPAAMETARTQNLAAFLQQSIHSALQAYYPLDGTYTASSQPLMMAADGTPLILVKAQSQPAMQRAVMSPGGAADDPDLPHLAGMDLNKAMMEQRQRMPQRVDRRDGNTLPGFFEEETIVWSRSGMAGGAPAAMNHVSLVPGVKGQAVLLNDSAGMADPHVGFFERTQPFSLDVWIKLRSDKPYADVNLLYNRYVRGQGYQLQLHDNRLHFSLVHLEPYNRLAITSKQSLPMGQWLHVTATYDGNSRAAGAHLYVNGAPVAVEIEQDHLTRSALPGWGRGPFDTGLGLAWGRSFAREEFKDGALDEIKVFTRALTPLEVAFNHDPQAAAKISVEESRQEVTEILAARDTNVSNAWQALRAAREAEQAIGAKIFQMMVMADAPTHRKTFVLNNGLYSMPREEVQAQGLERVFAWDNKLPRDRLGLARWLFDVNNPLTARVYVNRLWRGHFGTGIVETVDDFGNQGAIPTHPELLDWLAIEFVRSGWDIRHMHKLMVMSATYRQASDFTPVLLEKDARNLWLARGPRYRLPAEVIRDNALLASGLLVTRSGGDSVFPYQPDGVWDSIGVPAYVYPEQVPDDQMHRRSMYTFIRRNAPFPSLTVFDMADRNVSTVARRISNTPLQALVLLNDPQFMEAYRKLAERALHSGATAEMQLVNLFRLATRRHPNAAELSAMQRYLQAESERLRNAPQDVQKLLQIGVAPADASLAPLQLAAMTMVTAGVMNTPDAYSLR